TSTINADVGDVRRAEAMRTFMLRRFPSEIFQMTIGVVAMAVSLGLVLGLVAELLIRLRRPAPRFRLRSVVWAFARSMMLVAGLHTALLAWAMADTPQLYALEWYAEGGFGRTIQVVVTDWLGPRGVILVALAAAIAYIRPTRLASLWR